MPKKHQSLPSQSECFYKSIAYEHLVASWLLNDGWNVFLPLVDHGMKTDVVISDGVKFYRIQVKSVETSNEHSMVECQWNKVNIDYIIYFSRKEKWGYMTHSFTGKRKLNHKAHIKFQQTPEHFAQAFNSL
ncbi:hypothetical protein KIH87_06085 [Paraneptunicella aestuarii]|uniref:group I intron-associated PD-(D/E)XK endonuclease n=1 Tax=Paraneptunicella aestuarii TaxID=2831148 RepID=UPI001E39737D|nr:group I intron-associated PD-(D/E)XK endonuclease [Paraneptunicella aestuarii]UAA39920.1 hypothetical protein KIH87_06085 [Paraneptunicella aestuarii]